MTWHTDKKIGEVVVLPNGTKVKIVSIRGRRVRLEYLNPEPGTATHSTVAGGTGKEATHA
ncbi:MAG: hypothetical protein K8S99_14460 [Planctomycetes bacterium]|nr:hypothetical protein [Planctomycetota bacterium]